MAFSGTLRDLTAADRPAWSRLWSGYLDFYRSSVPEAVTEATFQRLLDPAWPMFALVAEQDGAAIGIVHCVLHPATWALEPYCYLEDLFVDPTVRGSGAGRALIEAVYARAETLGAARVYWLTHESNAIARALYDKVARNLGFIQYRN
ncbi:MAG: acetyltransferase family protein [Caulobacter sp.]|nr:acetyltransferase family protein [Caulobacter sp.]